MTWGTGGWGTGPWGGTGLPLSIAAAYAVTKRTIRVEFTAEPQHLSGFLAGDATNPKTWSVIRSDTGAALTVVAAGHYALPLVFDVVVAEDLQPSMVLHAISAPSMLSATGAAILPPTSANVAGAQDGDDLRPGTRTGIRRYQQRDLSSMSVAMGGAAAQTLYIDSSHNYASVTGLELVKKMMMRRLTTPRGAFFHLPDYGLGIAEKEPLPGGGLISLKAEVERQMLLEPEVATVSAHLTLSPGNLLSIAIYGTTRPSGEAFSFAMQSGGT